MCIRKGFPATMTNIVCAGFVGIFIASLFHIIGVADVLSMITEQIRILLRSSWDAVPGFGFLLGCTFCYGSKVGWYHSIYLPLILVEMECGEASIFGAIDECTLVLVSAGICAANVLLTKDELPHRGLKINIFCGDFIEVAYPYMEKYWIVNLFAYLASGVSTAILYADAPGKVLSSAYLPVPFGIFLAEDRSRMVLAMSSAFILSFLGMCSAIILSTRGENKKIK